MMARTITAGRQTITHCQHHYATKSRSMCRCGAVLTIGKNPNLESHP
jgi:hypothetical protein